MNPPLRPWPMSVSAARLVAIVMLLIGAVCVYQASGSEATASGTVGTLKLTDANALVLTGTEGSNQQFSVALAAGSKCSGDSTANGGAYHIWSYLLQGNGVLPTTITYQGGVPNAGNEISDALGSPLAAVNTGSGGLIPTMPNNLVFGTNLAKADLGLTGSTTSQVWEAGLDCANAAGAVIDYWNVELTFKVLPVGTAAGQDPNGYAWTQGTATASATTTTTSVSTTSSTVAATTTSSTTSTTTATTSTTSSTSPSSTTVAPAVTCLTTTTSAVTPTSTSSSSTSTSPSSTSTTSSSTTSTTSSTSVPTSTTAVPCPTTTTVGATATTSSPALVSGASSGGGSLPFTGANTGAELGLGVVLLSGGLLLLAAARRRQELERLAWPD